TKAATLVATAARSGTTTHATTPAAGASSARTRTALIQSAPGDEHENDARCTGENGSGARQARRHPSTDVPGDRHRQQGRRHPYRQGVGRVDGGPGNHGPRAEPGG